MASITVVSLLVLLGLFLPSSLSSANPLSFSLTYVEAPSSLLRSFEFDPADLPHTMPMRDFVAAGKALHASLKKQPNRAGPLLRKLSYKNNGDFYLTISAGSPPQDLILLIDTGSELIWSQCASPCTTHCTHTKAPLLFSFNQSSSFLALPCASRLCTSSHGFATHLTCNGSTTASFCDFYSQYGDGTIVKGYLSVDFFHLAHDFSKSMVFGCALIVNDTAPAPGTSGIMGLTPGPFSFTTQLFGTNTNLSKKFAHCLPDRLSNMNALGTIQFGHYKLAEKLSYTPFMISYSPLAQQYYYVKLEGITIGGSLIKVASKGEAVGIGGTIFDSGTSLTQLESSVYNEVVEQMKTQTAHLHPFAWTRADSNLCYKVPLKASEPPKVPLVTLHFAGKVDLELKPGSILYPADSDHKSIYLCLAFQKADDTLNIIGNYQQQNYWVEYNLQTSHLGLAKASCAK